jgi:hypothetical protein
VLLWSLLVGLRELVTQAGTFFSQAFVCLLVLFAPREHKAKRRGHLVMRWLKEGKDGLFRASTDTWEEPASCLLGVRTQWVPGKSGKLGGYRLLTLRSRILDTQLLD